MGLSWILIFELGRRPGVAGVSMFTPSCICVFVFVYLCNCICIRFLSWWPGVAGVPHVYSIFSLRLEGRNHQERCNCSKTGWANEDGAGKPYQSASHICHLNCPTLQNWIRNKASLNQVQLISWQIQKPGVNVRIPHWGVILSPSHPPTTLTDPLTGVLQGIGYRVIKLLSHLKRWHNLTF